MEPTKQKIIAIPMGYKGLCDHFEEFQYFLLYDFKDPKCVHEEIQYPPEDKNIKIPEWLSSFGVTDIFTRGIDYEIIKKLNYQKIHVFVGVSRKNPEKLVLDYMNNILSTDQHMCYRKMPGNQ